MTPPRFVVFDLFHTLVDPEDFRPKEFRRAVAVSETLGFEKGEFIPYWKSTEATRLTSSRPETELLMEFAARKGIRLTEDELRTADEALGKYTGLALMKPRKEVLDFLAVLPKTGRSLGILSNTVPSDARLWPQSPLVRFFDASVFSHELGHAKPDREAYEAILSRLGADPPSTAFVGNGGHDELAGAKKVGFGRVIFMKRFVATNGLWGESELGEFARQADATATDFDGLAVLLG